MNLLCRFGFHKWTPEFKEVFITGTFVLRTCARCLLTQYKDSRGKWHVTREVGKPLKVREEE